MSAPNTLRWAFGLTVAALVVVAPIIRYRAVYDHSRRLREVAPGVLYRSGFLTAEGFADAVKNVGIKTIVNLQDEFPDPAVRNSYFDTSTTPEVEMCKELGVRYVFIAPDLVSRQKTATMQPRAIDQFLAVMDDPTNYPVLIHCKAGLHRTGVMVAVYRMEYQGWTAGAALADVKANGFGQMAASNANEYIWQYVTNYRPRDKRLHRLGGQLKELTNCGIHNGLPRLPFVLCDFGPQCLPSICGLGGFANSESFSMTGLLDRLMIRSYVKSYVICLVSLLGLYIIIDLFMNVSEFGNRGLQAFLLHVGKYYAARSTTIFDRLSEMIVLLAAMFTIAWVQRNNELLPQLSAGVSTHRVVRPVLLAACAMMTLATLNQELLIPRLSYILSLNREDPQGERPLQVHAGYEPNGIYIRGSLATRKDMVVREFHANIKPPVAPGTPVNVHAKEARYIPPSSDAKPRTGGWMLTGATSSIEMEHWKRNDVLEPIAPTRFFLKTDEVDFDALTREPRKWFYLASTWRIFQELGKSEAGRLAPMAVLFHVRLTRPILGMILVFLGLSIILRDQNRNVFISAGLCLAICACFFAACFAFQQLGEKEYITPALAAWMPVMIFGPLAFVMFDAIHT